MAPARIRKGNDWVTPFTPCPSIQLAVHAATFENNLHTTGVIVETATEFAPKTTAQQKREWVERLMEGWESDMLALLGRLHGGTWTQRVVLAEIERRCASAKRHVTIWPRRYHAAIVQTIRTDSDVVDMYLNASESGRETSLTGPSKLANSERNIAGPGDSAIIEFDPSVWGGGSLVRDLAQSGNPTQYSGAGMEAEDVLFHELIHALRSLKGVSDRRRTETADYVSVEEFAACLITNITLNEKNPRGPLRYGEINFKPMPEPFRTSAGYLRHTEHVDLIRRLYGQDVSLMHNIAGSPHQNPFNPIRRYLRGAVFPAPMTDW